MGWKEKYAEKFCTADEAVSHIKSGDRVVIAHACSEPQVIIDAMVANADKYGYENVEIAHMVPMGKAPYCAPEMKDISGITDYSLGELLRRL